SWYAFGGDPNNAAGQGEARSGGDGAAGTDGAGATAWGTFTIGGFAPADGTAGTDGSPGRGGRGGSSRRPSSLSKPASPSDVWGGVGDAGLGGAMPVGSRRRGRRCTRPSGGRAPLARFPGGRVGPAARSGIAPRRCGGTRARASETGAKARARWAKRATPCPS